jgi:pimeloyl-ACP methyl ester carboxylesterase
MTAGTTAETSMPGTNIAGMPAAEMNTAAVTAGIDRLEIDANGFTFTARAAGREDGRGVILLHGFPQTSWSWRGQLSALADAGCRAVAPDQRGYSAGARPLRVADYGLDHLVGDVLALADTMKMDRFDLVGHDWGGLVSWVTAARHPERVRSLSVVSTPHPLALRDALLDDAAQATWSGRMDSFVQPEVPERLLLGADQSGSGLASLCRASGLAEAHTRQYLAVLTRPGALTAALNWYRAMEGVDLGDLPMVNVPTLYVWSSGDPALGRPAAEASAKFVTGRYRFVVLDGVSHWVPEAAPGELARLLVEHLATT